MFINGVGIMYRQTWLFLEAEFLCVLLYQNFSLADRGLPSGVRRASAAARLLGLRVQIPPDSWVSLCCECCVLSGRGLCDGLITRTEESYRVIIACDKMQQ